MEHTADTARAAGAVHALHLHALRLTVKALDAADAAREWLRGDAQRERDYPRERALIAGLVLLGLAVSGINLHAELARQDREAARLSEWAAAQAEAAREGPLCVSGRNLGPAPWELQWAEVGEDVVQLRSEASPEEAAAELERNEVYREGMLCVPGRNIGPELLGTPPFPAEAHESVEEIADADEGEADLLACAIYTLAGNCDETCQRMVGDVILNRVDDCRFPDRLENVLTQPRQFGFEHGVAWPARAELAAEAVAVERCSRVAKELLEGYHSELYGKGYVWCSALAQGHGNVWRCGLCFGM